MASFAEGVVLSDMEFVELAESFLDYADPQPFRSLDYVTGSAPARLPAAAREWSSLASQECLSAGAPAPMLPTGPSAPALHAACLSPSAGSSQDSLGHLESESSGRRREAQSNGGRAKRATILAVKRSGSGSGKARGSDRAAVSHSTVEKQRRDRINALIDELRELVPVITPWPKSDQQGDQKRPKHLVLSDTITMLKQLQEQVKAKDAQLKELATCAATVKLEQPACCASSPASTSEPLGGLIGLDTYQLPKHEPQPPALHMQLALQPSQQVVCSGITIEEGLGGCLYLRVDCMDRPGLLSDIMMALRSMPLDIRRASITTSPQGQVHDVFELVPLDPLLTSCEVSARVQAALKADPSLPSVAAAPAAPAACTMVPQGSSCMPLDDSLPWDLLH